MKGRILEGEGVRLVSSCRGYHPEYAVEPQVDEKVGIRGNLVFAAHKWVGDGTLTWVYTNIGADEVHELAHRE